MPLIIYQLNNSNLSTDKPYNLSPSSPQEGICRPNENIRNEWGDGETSNYTRINDLVEKPTAGDGIYNSHAGNYESKIDIFGMTTLEDYGGNMEITSITIHLYCKCRITRMGYAKIECRFRFGNNGDWFSKQSVQSPYGWGWKSFTWSDLSVSKYELDNLQIKLRALIQASGWGGWVAVDAMYAEIEYRISYDAIVRPDENIQIGWSGSSYENINDSVEIPAIGDGTSNAHGGHDESEADIFGMTTIDNIYKVLSITVNLYCSCKVYSAGYAEIGVRYRFGEGDWSTEQWVRSPFSMGWKSFSWGVADARQADLNELEIRLTARIEATGFGGVVKVDVMYVKVQYSGHDSYPPSKELVGANNKYFPNEVYSKLGFLINSTNSVAEDVEILFSIKEEVNDPYERYLRVYIDSDKIYEYYFDFSSGGNFVDTFIANDLKIEGYHYIVLEIFNGFYGSVPHYKLNYVNISHLEFVELPQTLPWGVDRVDAERVWGNYEDAEHVIEGNNAGQGINVLVIDTGINYLHPDLMDNYVWGYDWVDDDFAPMDEDGHGTICAGVIAAVDNAFGIIGTAPKINLYAARVAWVDDYGFTHINAYDLEDALVWAAFPYDRPSNMRPEGNPKMDIISMSIGFTYDVNSPDLEYWCDTARDQGVVLVAASGNYHEVLHPSHDVVWPANYDSVISVGASDQNDQWADFSCYIGDLDVVAPGVDIISTGLTELYLDNLDGTSLACPHVAGICALILYSNPNLTPSQLENILFDTAIYLGDERTGYGLVNAYNALG